ncbi:MAG: putative ABC transporter permease [Lachnospiraceae bacterium]|nr:putative ABC transporter permease [Lachnospiraceae bacterium]
METTLKNKKLTKFENFAMYFFIYSFLGWFFETLYAIYELGEYTNRGFLFGPLCPIYGYAALMLIMFLGKYKKNSFKLFLYSAIIFSAFEYIVSFGLEGLFRSHWWDYSNEFFNLNGRVSVFFTVVWGVAALLFLNHFHPYIKKFLRKRTFKKIPILIQKISIYLLITVYTVDSIASMLIESSIL